MGPHLGESQAASFPLRMDPNRRAQRVVASSRAADGSKAESCLRFLTRGETTSPPRALSGRTSVKDEGAALLDMEIILAQQQTLPARRHASDTAMIQEPKLLLLDLHDTETGLAGRV